MPDIADKLRYLLAECEIGEEDFATQFQKQHRTKKAVVREWLSGTDAQGGSLKKLTLYWSTAVPTLTVGCWSKDPNDFESQVLECTRGPKTMNFVLPAALPRFERWEEAALPGMYRVYRYAYKNNGDVAFEWLVISAAANANYYVVQLYSVSINDVRPPGENTDSAKSSPAYELFEGRLYRSAQAYVGILFYKDGAHGIRTRTLELAWPVRGAVPNVWWGLLTGVGARSLSPSCARMVAERRTGKRQAVALADADLQDVRYGGIEEVPENYRSAISNDVKTAAAKNVPSPTGPGDYVLISGTRSA